MRSPKIFVTGANGQLGRELRALAADLSQYDFFFFDRATMPVEDPEAIETFLAREKPQWLINCAAYTAVDKAESEKETAFLVNGDAVGWLAAACRGHNTRLIHISTDYVFNGSSATPLKETDPTDPINTYGASKLEGERQALQQYPDGTVILRTSWVYSEFGNNFVKTMIRLMKERPSINVVNDQIGTPTYAADLAAAIMRIISNHTHHSPKAGSTTHTPPIRIPPSPPIRTPPPPPIRPPHPVHPPSPPVSFTTATKAGSAGTTSPSPSATASEAPASSTPSRPLNIPPQPNAPTTPSSTRPISAIPTSCPSRNGMPASSPAFANCVPPSPKSIRNYP